MVEIISFMDRIKERCKKELNIEIINKINTKQHQLQNNECGVYAINYIVERLKGNTFEDVVSNVIRDNEMNKRRDLYFRQHGGRKRSKNYKSKLSYTSRRRTRRMIKAHKSRKDRPSLLNNRNKSKRKRSKQYSRRKSKRYSRRKSKRYSLRKSKRYSRRKSKRYSQNRIGK